MPQLQAIPCYGINDGGCSGIYAQPLNGAPFKDSLSYTPEKVYADAEGKERVYDEMWTGDWWWDVQVRDDSVGHGGGGSPCPRRP